MNALDLNTIEHSITTAETPIEGLINLYKAVFPNWETIKTLTGFPKVNRETAYHILRTFRKTFPNEGNGIVLMWLNNGFGIDESLADYEVKPCEYEVAE
jgi:hypothetical protein